MEKEKILSLMSIIARHSDLDSFLFSLSFFIEEKELKLPIEITYDDNKTFVEIRANLPALTKIPFKDKDIINFIINKVKSEQNELENKLETKLKEMI